MPSLRVTPRPLTRKVRPLVVPDGSRSVTGAPPRVGTLISAPSAASGNVTGKDRVRLSPLRPKSRCGCTCTVTMRSPVGPPRSPGAPLPLSRMCCPSRTPAGMRTLRVRVPSARPLPWQVGQGSSTTRPRPRHSRHGSANAKPPWLRVVWPVPRQTGHWVGRAPSRPPVPWQLGHGFSLDIRSGTVTPSTASWNDSVTSDSMSAPRRGDVVRPPARPPKRPPSTSPRPPAPCPPGWPNRSPRSNANPPPPGPPAPAGAPRRPKPPVPNRVRASSYSLRRLSSERTS